jgi:beta-glucosidase
MKRLPASLLQWHDHRFDLRRTKVIKADAALPSYKRMRRVFVDPGRVFARRMEDIKYVRPDEVQRIQRRPIVVREVFQVVTEAMSEQRLEYVPDSRTHLFALARWPAADRFEVYANWSGSSPRATNRRNFWLVHTSILRISAGPATGGAAHDSDLIRRIGQATAAEVAATGMNWTFAPTLSVPRDVRWGRSYEGYSEDPRVVADYAEPITVGFQGPLVAGRPLAPDHVVATAKHFLADGGTKGGVDQGDAELSEADLIRLHAQGYPAAIDAGILSVMISASSWNGVKNANNIGLLTDVLKGRLGFKGLVVGAWNAQGQVLGCSQSDCPQALNAGLDMFMAPDTWKALDEHTVAEVRSGIIPIARLNDAVRRVLRVKFKAGLFDARLPIAGQFDLLGQAAHRMIAREAVRKSLVMLKNNRGLLPIKPSAYVLVAGDGADNIGKQCGGWTFSSQGVGNRNIDFPNGQSIYAAIADAVGAGGGQAELAADGNYRNRPDVAIVVFGEDPYAESHGDLNTLEYQRGNKRDLNLLKKLKADRIPVVSVFLSGRPLRTTLEIRSSDAFVAAWLPGTEGGGIADVLIGQLDGRPRYDFEGKLPYSWPRRSYRTAGHQDEKDYDPEYPYGYGMTYAAGKRVPVLSERVP